MNDEKLDNRNAFQNFIKQKNEIAAVLEIDELFEFLNKHFQELHQQENFQVVLALVHRCIKVWIWRQQDDIGILLANFLAEHNGCENDTNIAIQIVYQILNSIKFFDSKIIICEKVLRELVEILSSVESRSLASNCIACIQKYIEMFPSSRKNLETLWSNLKERLALNIHNGLVKEIEIDILMQLFDCFKILQYNFHDETVLITTIQYLLKSDQRKLRKCGFFLLRKLYQCFIENMDSIAKMWMSTDHAINIKRSWTIFITVLENLEEEQSHLILPSLNDLEELVKNHHLPMSWLNILFFRLLTHNNNLVVRCSIEFLFKTFSVNDLCEDTLKHVLKASNCNSLFNYEGYFLKNEYFFSFLNGNVTNLLKLFPEIPNWKSLPLFKWLENLNRIQHLEKDVSFNDILKFCACVRKCQNKEIRNKSIEQCHIIFNDDIKRMSIKEYVLCIETLYNPGDQYYDHTTFYAKKSLIIQSKESLFSTQRFYEICTVLGWSRPSMNLLSFLKDIPVEEHGWLQYELFNYELKKEDLDIIKALYKLDLKSLDSCSIEEIISSFHISLLGQPPYDKNELAVCNKAAIAFYIHKRYEFNNLDKATLNLLINSGIQNHHTLFTFAKKLLSNNNLRINSYFLKELLKYKMPSITNLVFMYLVESNAYDLDTVRSYAKILLEQIARNEISSEEIPNATFSNISTKVNIIQDVTDVLLQISPSQGDKRIEEYFTKYRTVIPLYPLYCMLVQGLGQKLEYNKPYVLGLIKEHLTITKKKSRYFENSYEHRIKLRIAICIYYCFTCGWDTPPDEILSEIWNILLNENNQLNITYIYEYILASFESNVDRIKDKLNEALNLTSSQQVSIITVAYTYFAASESTTESMKITVVNNLLSLSMGANFQTRLHAQLSLYKLLKGTFKDMTNYQYIIQSIEAAAGGKINDYLKDVRLNFADLPVNKIDSILCITKAPYDELCSRRNLFISEDIENYCANYIKKLKLTTNEKTAPPNEVNDQIQRKMNPIQDLTEPHSLIVYPTEKKTAEMYVVASLIDKLPNLGGIARTCEVLGIKNLVMDSKSHTEKNDFKNLSMTAEKTLNIQEVKPKDLQEFLISKRLEGFKIVGAEQTCKSKSFNEFKFPEKCVLLLGHEKDGIPAPLLGILDNAVEIPQFGQVRSLNVHVTGALFMWEYCKQHLLQE